MRSALAVALLTGCLGPSASVERSSAGIATSNGQSLNGQRLNGQSLNGRFLNGRLRNGRLRNGRLRNGTALDAIRAQDGFLVGNDAEGLEIVLAEGDSFAAVLDDDRDVTIVVGAPVATAQAVAYPLSYTTPDDPNPRPVCEG